MTNEEKATQLSQKHYPDEDNVCARAIWKSACREMAEWKDEKIKEILITIYSFRDIKNIKGYVNEKYKSITGKNIKLPKCMEEECHESAQMKLKDAQIGELKQALIDKACEWLKRELAEPMPDEMYQKWCDEKIIDFRKAMED